MSARADIVADLLAEEAKIYLTGGRDWRVDASPAPGPWTVDRDGLEALVDAAVADSGMELPWNLATHGPAVHLRRKGSVTLPLAERDHLVSAYARMGGWIRAAGKDPFLASLIERTQSKNGVNSPRTTMGLWGVAERYSPGAASRRGRTIRYRANQILSAYGLKVSWGALGATLEYGPKRTGKAAIYAAACTLSGESWFTGYREARDYLIRASSDAVPVYSRHGVVITQGWKPEGIRRIPVYRIEVGGRVFQFNPWQGRGWTPRELIKYARGCWARYGWAA